LSSFSFWRWCYWRLQRSSSGGKSSTLSKSLDAFIMRCYSHACSLLHASARFSLNNRAAMSGMPPKLIVYSDA
jgi:hypothetical protein